MVIVGHMSSKSAFGAKNTGQKFLTPKNFWWCRNVCHDSCPGVIFGAGRGGAAPSFSGGGRGGAGQSWKFSGPGRPGAAIFPGARAGRASLTQTHAFLLKQEGKYYWSREGLSDLCDYWKFINLSSHMFSLETNSVPKVNNKPCALWADSQYM